MLEEQGPAAALEASASQFEGRSGIDVVVTTRGHALADDSGRPSAVAICLYRVAQDSLNNVAKHSGAERAQIFLGGLADDGNRHGGGGGDPGAPQRLPRHRLSEIDLQGDGGQ